MVHGQSRNVLFRILHFIMWVKLLRSKRTIDKRLKCYSFVVHAFWWCCSNEWMVERLVQPLVLFALNFVIMFWHIRERSLAQFIYEHLFYLRHHSFYRHIACRKCWFGEGEKQTETNTTNSWTFVDCQQRQEKEARGMYTNKCTAEKHFE